MIDKKLFESLVTKIINEKKYENDIPTKYNNKDYTKFVKFCEKIEDITEVTMENFETFFVAFYKFKNDSNRVNFSPNIKKEIAEKSAYCCAMRHCRRYTKEYDTIDVKKPSGFGQAAHIYSASQNNKTRQPTLIDKSELESETNGLWLCSNCHPYADYIAAEDLYPVAFMVAYKHQIEDQVKNFLTTKNKTYDILNNKEKNELQNLIYSTKVNVDFNNLTKQEARYILARNAVSKGSVKLSDTDRFKYFNLEEIEIPVDRIYFNYVDKELKELMGSTVKLQNIEFRKFMLSFEKKHKSYVIKNCKLSRKGNKATTEGYFFDKIHPFHKIITFIYSYDIKNKKVDMQIRINFDELFNGKYEINKVGDFSEILELIDMIENNNIKVEISKNEDNEYKVINDYQKLECNFNQFKNLAIFFKLIQNISNRVNLKMVITDDVINRNKIIFQHLDILYDTIIFDEPPKYFTFKPYYYYEFEDFYNKYNIIGSKYIIMDHFCVGFTIYLKDYIININLGNYSGVNGALIRKNNKDVHIDVNDAPFLFSS